MKYYSILFSYLFYCIGLNAQLDSLPIYFIDNQDVVLEFDIRNYQNELKPVFSEIFEMRNVDVISNIQKKSDWSQNGWQAHKVTKHVYQLRKALDAFDKPFSWTSKYSINGAHWAEPLSELDHSGDSIFIDDLINPKPKVAVVAENGNAAFQLAGFKNARKVILAGSFNDWDEQEIIMQRSDSGWVLQLELQHGIYEYKFIVDGIWMHDNTNPLKVLNEHETWNSILLVGQTIDFMLSDHTKAKEVILSGSFNSWNEQAFKMKKQATGWQLDVPLPPGKHYYKFIVDGKWILDPDNNLQQPDGLGNWNSVLLIH